ncbi:MAG: helix-turn-helix domain-containing protein [Thermomicrobiales bacterium]
MNPRNGEITLRDLMSWEPRLRILMAGTSIADEDPLDRDVEWVVTARTGAPMLPTLRGAELVMMPQRIVVESGVPLAMLIAELAGQPVAGVVVDRLATPPPDAQLPILGVPIISTELESDLNRMLTSQRGDLLRTGADIERTIAELTARDARPGELIELLAARLKLGITVTSASGAVLFSTTEPSASRPPILDKHGEDGGKWIEQPLFGQRMLRIGPVAPNQRALGRLVIRRLRDGIQRSLDQADSTAPHGAARVLALNALLQVRSGATPEHLTALALRAGLSAGAQVRVALHTAGVRDVDVRRRLATLGALHDAGTIDGLAAHIVTSRATEIGSLAAASPGDSANLAISAPFPSARHLAEAVRQARFIAGVQQRRLLEARDVRFDDDARLGALRILYDRWGTPELDRYVDSLIGDLLREDRRGVFRNTLRVYLESGGAQRPTSERLGIHRNTLAYRMRQIRSLLALDPDDPHGRLGLHLAVLASELPPPPSASS